MPTTKREGGSLIKPELAAVLLSIIYPGIVASEKIREQLAYQATITMSSQPVGGNLEVAELRSFIRGYQKYKDIIMASNSGLVLKREPDNKIFLLGIEHSYSCAWTSSVLRSYLWIGS